MTIHSTPSGDDAVMLEIIVRRATADDLDALLAADPRSDLRLPAKRLAEQAEGTGILALAEVNGQVASSGFLDFIDEELVPELKNLWVIPSLRRHGVGTALWLWLEDQAREAGHNQVFLAVDPNNSRAIPFFLDLGYSPTGDHLFTENPDASTVPDPTQVSHHYSIYRKSLLAG